MAEALMRDIVGANEDWQVESAGIFADVGRSATEPAQDVMAEIGAELKDHRSQPITAELLHKYPLVLVMEPRHREYIQEKFPDYGDRVYLFSEMIGEVRPIEDPFGSEHEAYRATREELRQTLEASKDRIMVLSDEVE
jgi:protein-tyrosine phosphatase